MRSSNRIRRREGDDTTDELTLERRRHRTNTYGCLYPRGKGRTRGEQKEKAIDC